MTNELPLSHYSRQWLGLVAVKAKLLPTRQGERWLLHLTPGSPNARTVTLHLRWSGVQWQLLSLTNAEDWHTMSHPVDEICVDPSVGVSGAARRGLSRSPNSPECWGALLVTCSAPAFITAIAWRVTPYPKRRHTMPKQPIAVELEAINRDGETLVVRDSGITVHVHVHVHVHGYSVYLRAVEGSGLALATWVADYDTVGPAYKLAERLSVALAIPLTVLVPESLMSVQSGPAATGN